MFVLYCNPSNIINVFDWQYVFTLSIHLSSDVNDFILFTVAGIGSLISGVVYTHFSWGVLIYCSAFLVSYIYYLHFYFLI